MELLFLVSDIWRGRNDLLIDCNGCGGRSGVSQQVSWVMWYLPGCIQISVANYDCMLGWMLAGEYLRVATGIWRMRWNVC